MTRDISVYTMKGRFLKTFKTYKEASIFTGIHISSIDNYMGHRRTCKKYIFSVPEIVHIQGERWKRYDGDPRYWISNKMRIVGINKRLIETCIKIKTGKYTSRLAMYNAMFKNE